jgi:glycosyltransferase involved in cell wall biosynthesis
MSSPASVRPGPLHVLQLNNRQLSHGGSTILADHEATLLETAGHRVARIEVDNADIADMGRMRAAGKAIWNVATSRDVARYLRDEKPDVVHLHTPYPLLGVAPLRPAQRAGVATIVTMHGYRFVCVNGLLARDGVRCELCVGSRTRWPGVRHRCYHNSAVGSAALATSLVVHRSIGTVRDVTEYLCVSKYSREVFIRDGFRPEQLRVRYNFAPDTGEGPARRERAVSFVARLSPEKGVRALLEAWDLLDDPPTLHIAGDGPLRAEVEAAVARNPAIRFHGWLDGQQAHAIVSTSAYALVPSECAEGGPMVVIEALAAGTPIIGSAGGAIEESVTDFGAGFLIEAKNAHDLAAKVVQAFDPGVDHDALRARARRGYLDRHTPERALEALLDAYRAGVARSSRSVP